MINKKAQCILKVFYWLVFLLIIIIAVLLVISQFDFKNGYRLYNIDSGSMTPAIKPGSLIISMPSQEYKKGDIIVFKFPNERKIKRPKFTATHRIYDIIRSGNTANFITKGDANKKPDIIPITKDLIIGKVAFVFPYIGYLVSFTKTQFGFIVLIIIPATIIVYSEIINIKNQALRLIQESKTRKLSTVEKIEEKIGEEIISVEKEVKKDIKKVVGQKRRKK